MPVLSKNEHHKRVIGRFLEHLTLEERQAIAGKWAAFETYTPETLPLRRIEALGASSLECIRQLRERGLDPRRFEFVLLKPTY